MAESNGSTGEPSLSQRFDDYGQVVQDLVLHGIEHPSCELKRAVIVDRGTIDRLDFLKLIQGQANSHHKGERLIVIGADQKEKKFFHVENAAEFDPARLSPIFAKYFSPEPLYDIFTMTAEGGETYILIVLGANQPRPILIVTQGDAEGKSYLRPGDIWIKHNTGLRNATKADLDLMYELRIEQEAEKRARQRFEHFKEELGPALLSQAVTATPVPELLVGSRERLARFAQAMMSNGEETRFQMLLEMARESLVVRWAPILVGSKNPHSVSEEAKTEVAEFYKNEFMPTSQSVVDLGMLLVKYAGRLEWLSSVVDLLIEAFETSGSIDRLHAINEAGSLEVPYARPAFEIYLGVRTIAIYTVSRNRLGYLKELLPRYVNAVELQRYTTSLCPILFWPFAGDLNLPDVTGGRNENHWSEGVGKTWGEYFQSREHYLAAAAELELALEFNSYLIVRSKQPLVEAFRSQFPGKYLAYMPDFWRSRLAPAVPMAEVILDSLKAKGSFPSELAVEPLLTDAVFKAMSEVERVSFLGEVLDELHKWQGQVAMSRGAFGYQFSWPGHLKDAVELYRKSIAQSKT